VDILRSDYLLIWQDTLGSVGVIVSTILIKWTGWSGFDPLASIFIAVLIVASVVPLVIDSGRILCLDVGEHKEKEIRDALAEVSQIRQTKLTLSSLQSKVSRTTALPDSGPDVKANMSDPFIYISHLRRRLTTPPIRHPTLTENTVRLYTPMPLKSSAE
jgi:Co/Zn/Cd efflux system component